MTSDKNFFFIVFVHFFRFKIVNKPAKVVHRLFSYKYVILWPANRYLIIFYAKIQNTANFYTKSYFIYTSDIFLYSYKFSCLKIFDHILFKIRRFLRALHIININSFNLFSPIKNVSIKDNVHLFNFINEYFGLSGQNGKIRHSNSAGKPAKENANCHRSELPKTSGRARAMAKQSANEIATCQWRKWYERKSDFKVLLYSFSSFEII